jgi:hypothetical protein
MSSSLTPWLEAAGEGPGEAALATRDGTGLTRAAGTGVGIGVRMLRVSVAAAPGTGVGSALRSDEHPTATIAMNTPAIRAGQLCLALVRGRARSLACPSPMATVHFTRKLPGAPSRARQEHAHAPTRGRCVFRYRK